MPRRPVATVLAVAWLIQLANFIIGVAVFFSLPAWAETPPLGSFNVVVHVRGGEFFVPAAIGAYLHVFVPVSAGAALLLILATASLQLGNGLRRR